MATSAPATNSLFKSVFGALRTLLHFTAAVQFTYGIYYDYKFVEFPAQTDPNSKLIYHPFGGKFKYLTFLNAVRYQKKLSLTSSYYNSLGQFEFKHVMTTGLSSFCCCCCQASVI